MKVIIAAIVIVIIVITGSIILVKNKNPNNTLPAINNVAVIDGQQIITIKAKGGYSPRVTRAQADLPTVIKVATGGTFDCSAALVIPTLNYRKNLPPSGETEIVVPAQTKGTTITGLCAMGMYNFVINFE